jgi:hypothetical protein
MSGYKKQEDLLDMFESETWLDSQDFKAYRRRVEDVVFSAWFAAEAAGDETFRGVTTRYIHETLGSEARYDWTKDALDGSQWIMAVGVNRTLYRPNKLQGWQKIAARTSPEKGNKTQGELP